VEVFVAAHLTFLEAIDSGGRGSRRVVTTKEPRHPWQFSFLPMTAKAAFAAGVQAFRDGKYNEAVEKFSDVRGLISCLDRVRN